MGQLGHEGTRTTTRHYIDPSAAIEAAAARVFADLSTGLDECDDDGAEGVQRNGQPITGKPLPTGIDSDGEDRGPEISRTILAACSMVA